MAKLENAIHALGGGKPARRRARGQHQPVIAHALASAGFDLAARRVDGRDTAVVDQLNVMRGEPVRLAKREPGLIAAITGKKGL